MSELVKMAITDTTDNEDEYAEIADIYDIPVVSCQWVIMSHKCGRLLPTKPFPPKLTAATLFKGKVFCASHIGKSDLDSLWAMMTFYGGAVQRSLSPDVTHLVCTGTAGKKYTAATSKFPKISVVTPDWVTTCIKSNKVIEETEYHPKLLIGSNSPALRRQLLSPIPPPSAEPKKKATKSPSRQKSKVSSPAVFQQPPSTTTSPAMGTTPTTHMPPYANMAQGPRGRSPRPRLHEMPSGFPGFQHEAGIHSTLAQHMGQPMMNSPPRHPHRPQMSAQFGDPNLGPPSGYPMLPGGHLQPPPGHHQVNA